MDSAVIQALSGLLALVSVTAGVFTAIRSTKDRRERDAERDRVMSERQKLDAEGDKIKNEAAEIALRALRSELDAAYRDIERRRVIMEGQDERITAQDQTIRAQARQIAELEDAAVVQRRRLDRLEKWVQENKVEFEKIGVDEPHEPQEEPRRRRFEQPADDDEEDGGGF